VEDSKKRERLRSVLRATGTSSLLLPLGLALALAAAPHLVSRAGLPALPILLMQTESLRAEVAALRKVVKSIAALVETSSEENKATVLRGTVRCARRRLARLFDMKPARAYHD
jgi:hypothetical protein